MFCTESNCYSYFGILHSENSIKKEEAERVWNAISSLKNLTELNLSYNRITDKDVIDIAAKLTKLTKLSKLNLSDNKIGNDGIVAIAGGNWVNLTFLGI